MIFHLCKQKDEYYQIFFLLIYQMHEPISIVSNTKCGNQETYKKHSFKIQLNVVATKYECFFF